MGDLCELEIQDCPGFSSVISMSWIENLRRVTVKHVKLLENFEYSKSSDGVELNIEGKHGLHGLDQALFFDKETSLEKLTLKRCPPLELKHLLMLTSLKTLMVWNSVSLVGPLGGQGNVEWQLPVEHIKISNLNGNSGKELTELLSHLPKLSNLDIQHCKNIKQLVVGVDVKQTTPATPKLVFPAHLFDSLRELEFYGCLEVILVDPRTLLPEGVWLQALRSLQRLTIQECPKFLSAFSFSGHLFPSSLEFLKLTGVKGMGTLEPLSNLSSLTRLELYWCGEDLKCQGLQSLLTTSGQLSKLRVIGSPGSFANWDPNPRRELEDVEGGQEQPVSSRLQELYTYVDEGLLSAPVCSLLSSSLTMLELQGGGCEGMERFSKEQEDALQLLSSLQQLHFSCFQKLQQLPAGLHNLTSLKELMIYDCPAISSLPKDGLPKSLQKLWVSNCGNQELIQQCRGLKTSCMTFL
ncbi:unnamed protein product [Triticum turgidum subsp. durum]|uniref:Uncharacterized protein n=1 Tax=Triticum turgidum subsp. durum TaxID=4567 RepID=A0A9R1PAC4_TRITD|nr:unnamed protein product [Triticum turgidum subsp. durum]